MEQQEQYFNLLKPFWAPPPWLFGPVWSVLYVIIAISFGMIFYKAIIGKLSLRVAAPFLANIFFNLAFTPIQFGMRNNLLAFVDIVLVLATLVWALSTAYRHIDLRWVTYANIPYLIWTSFATILQLTITWMNRP